MQPASRGGFSTVQFSLSSEPFRVAGVQEILRIYALKNKQWLRENRSKIPEAQVLVGEESIIGVSYDI